MPLVVDLSSDELAKLARLAGSDRSPEQVIRDLISGAEPNRTDSVPVSDRDDPVQQDIDDVDELEQWMNDFAEPCGGQASIDRASWYPEPGE